jgi:hypothetical protein
MAAMRALKTARRLQSGANDRQNDYLIYIAAILILNIKGMFI